MDFLSNNAILITLAICSACMILAPFLVTILGIHLLVRRPHLRVTSAGLAMATGALATVGFVLGALVIIRLFANEFLFFLPFWILFGQLYVVDEMRRIRWQWALVRKTIEENVSELAPGIEPGPDHDIVAS